MLLSTLQRLGRSAFEASSFLIGPAADDPVRRRPVDLQRLVARLHDAEALAWPCFMSLHAVRDGAHIVDFEWDDASVGATQMLCGRAGGLIGQRLVEVLAGRPGRGELFNHYWRVVEYGAACDVQQRIETNDSVEVLRHAVLRLHDGVAVTLTNLTALRRALALRREIHARALMMTDFA